VAAPPPAVERQSELKSVRNALVVLELVAAARDLPKVAEVAERAGLPRPTVYRLVQTLVEQGYLLQDPRDGRLAIGYGVLPLAGALLDVHRLRRAALPLMQTLAQTTGKRVNLGILHRAHVFSLGSIEKPSLPPVYSRFGNAVPPHSCGLGKAILAGLDEAQVREIARPEPLIARTPDTITRLADLLADLGETRRRGFAIDRGEGRVGSFCVAVAIVDALAQPIGAVSISGRELDAVLPHAPLLQETVEMIEHLLAAPA
jgi:DNA-binding IclR family transcriptional regulator